MHVADLFKIARDEHLDTVRDENFFLGDPLLDELNHFRRVLLRRDALDV